MKKKPFQFPVILILLSIASCRTNDDPQICVDMYHALRVNITYEDEHNKNLLFGEDATYSLDDLRIYYKQPNDAHTPVYVEINNKKKHISIDLEKKLRGTFYIKLNDTLIDEITYTAKPAKQSLCDVEFFLTDLKLKEATVRYDENHLVWKIIK